MTTTRIGRHDGLFAQVFWCVPFGLGREIVGVMVVIVVHKMFRLFSK